MSKTKRRQKEYWDKKKRSRPQENKPDEPQRLTQQQAVPQRGLRLPSPATQGQRYLMEAANGMLVSVPEEEVNDWLEAQQSYGSEPLSSTEQRLLDKVLQLLYGKDTK